MGTSSNNQELEGTFLRREKFDSVSNIFGHVRMLREADALKLRDLILRNNLRSLLELGCYHGKSASYFAAVLEDRGGAGHVTTMDRRRALSLKPNVNDMLATLGLAHRVSVVLEPRSFTIALMKMLEQSPRPSFDFCFFDGAHTWDGTGFAFLLVDRLLVPGGWAVFDDLKWSMARSRSGARDYPDYREEERKMRQVEKVWNILVPELGYERHSEEGERWGIARKPLR